ncbi:uncharacterized protein LOC127749656, partial [Frankliniella occidentalis]|uniref:Uncharacterized protein LOC127749656 n=1 Tax=Frankliniella occidentalis TaxID=133901 RepID=A0A9C6WQN8_FRAOC
MRCSPIITLREEELEEQIKGAILGVLNSYEFSSGEGSQILFGYVEKLEVRVGRYCPLRGSSYLPLPKWLQHPAKGLINIQNYDDDKCFMYCVMAGIQLPVNKPERVSHYKNWTGVSLNFSGIKFPVELNQISKFEKQNKNIAVTVFGLEGEREIVPLRISKECDRIYHIRMLLMTTEDDESHYVFIKNVHHFLGHLSKQKRTLYWCDNCLTPTESAERRKIHQELCFKNEAQAVRLPHAKDKIMRFTNWAHCERHDYCIYADTEALLVPVHTAFPDPAIASTTKTQVHQPCGYAYVIVKQDGHLLKPPVVERGGNDIMERFLLNLKKEESEIEELRGEDYPIDMSPEDELAFAQATHCYLCKESLPREGVKKVRDHNHKLSEKNYRGAACSAPCNLGLREKRFINVIIHNSGKYDTHAIISCIGRVTSDLSEITLIPRTKERYISFSWGKLRFLDSYNFLSSSLDSLVRDLTFETDFEILKEVFPEEEKQKLLLRKGVYPYSHMQSVEVFEEKSLPSKDKFWNDLSEEHISDEDYLHAQKVWETFECKTMGEFHDLYVKSDSLILACVFEAYRRMTMKNFNLDVAYYYSSPGFAWDAALLYTGEKLELISDSMEIFMMWEKATRGGICTINERYAECNNPYVPETYDASKERNYLVYFDAVNLYGKCLSQSLPTSGFSLLSEEEIKKIDISKLEEGDSIGYLFEVDLLCPDHLHDYLNDFPPAPVHKTVKYVELSKLQKKMIRLYGLPKRSTKKLIPTLERKEKYIVYSATLKLYLSLGLKIEKIHRVVKFNQKPWLEKYIRFNTEQRQKCTSEFQKSMWKLLNNSVFGKTIESVRKRRNVYLTKSTQKFLKHVKSPLFHSFEMFDNDVVAVEKRKACIVLNRPLYSGAVCLDLAKEHMFKFYYNIIKPRYGENVRTCVHDTDSYILSIKTDDLYKDMEAFKDELDLSNYKKDHFLYSSKNARVLGKFKDELGGDPLCGVVGLAPKLYCLKLLGDKHKSVAKGVPRSAVRTQISYVDYKNCIESLNSKSVTYGKIGTDQKHHLFTTFSSRRALQCFDNKRYILSSNVETLAFGHY